MDVSQIQTGEEINTATPTTSRRATKQVQMVKLTLEREKKNQNNNKNVALKPKKSATANILRILLPESALPNQYEALKLKMKTTPMQYQEEMKVISAKIGVQLQLKLNKSWDSLRQIEQNTVLQSSETMVVNNNNKDQHEKLKNDISLCMKLKDIFSLSEPF